MKSFISVFIAAIIFSVLVSQTANGQNTLTFSQGLIVGSSIQTVPSGKIWKVESIFGEQVNACAPADCRYNGKFAKGIVSGMYVNAVFVPSTTRGFTSSHLFYNDDQCASTYTSGADATCNNKTSDPNILPMWLPAGTTLVSGGSTTFVNVLEFNIE